MINMIKSAILIIITLFLSGCSYNYLDCNDLPNIEQVREIVRENDDAVKEIKEVGQSVEVFVDDSDFPGKGKITILYGTEKQREEIEDMIGDTFFGVPYKMYNV